MKNLLLFLICSCFMFAPASPIFGVEVINKAPKTDTVMQNVHSDADVTRAVKDAFAADKFLSAEASKVDVKTDMGVVTLTGTVSSEKFKKDFKFKAKDVDGVKNVVNNITVK